jgi:hypothetical protein
MTTVAFYATFRNTHGVALRTSAGTVHFQADATGLWTELFDHNAADLLLHGRADIADAQLLADGDKVSKTSRTLQRAA